MADTAVRKPINPAALPPADAARMMSKVLNTTITEAMLRADIAAGAPTNADGTLNIVNLAAWLLRERGRNGGDAHAE